MAKNIKDIFNEALNGTGSTSQSSANAQAGLTGNNPLKNKLDAAAANSASNPVKTQLQQIAAANNPAKTSGGGTGGGTQAQAQAAGSAAADWDPYGNINQVTGGGTPRPANEAYNPSQQVRDAQAAMQAAQQGQPGAYAPSAEVLAAQTALQNLQNNKPQGYTSKYGPQLDALMEQIQNPGQFKYEFNGDNLFKQYADMYTQQGKQAAQNAMGQAAALTGGYGNSYAQQVANQAYDQNLTQLYDIGMELRDRAYQQWLDEQQNLYNQYGLLNDAENTAYNQYRDTVGDWRNDLGFAADQLNAERNYDYNLYNDAYDRWMNNRNYATDVFNNERNFDYDTFADRRNLAEQQYQYDANMAENIRQFNESMNWEKMSEQQKYAADYAMNILAMGQMPTDSMLQAAGLSRADAEKLKAQLATGGGGGGGKKSTPTLAAEGMNGQLWQVDEYGNVVRDANNVPVNVDPTSENLMMLNGTLNNKLPSVLGIDLNQGEKKKKGNYTPFKD